ncbi:MAG: methyltransferase domain-containing protein, partial [Candidatus Omnitrophica bacterium]|nr:methyltransferase domain-containing protein [Candidatus Omnitrophota bacterium]
SWMLEHGVQAEAIIHFDNENQELEGFSAAVFSGAIVKAIMVFESRRLAGRSEPYATGEFEEITIRYPTLDEIRREVDADGVQLAIWPEDASIEIEKMLSGDKKRGLADLILLGRMILRKLQHSLNSPVIVVVSGDSGVGKSTLIHAIHKAGLPYVRALSDYEISRMVARHIREQEDSGAGFERSIAGIEASRVEVIKRACGELGREGARLIFVEGNDMGVRWAAEGRSQVIIVRVEADAKTRRDNILARLRNTGLLAEEAINRETETLLSYTEEGVYQADIVLHNSQDERISIEEAKAWAQAISADAARPLPGEPMPSAQDVGASIQAAGWDNAQAVSIDSPEVALAASYLRSTGRNDMADYLEYLARAGLIRAGPFKGFLATPYQEGIALSTNYPAYNTPLERAASLIHEIGATARFNLTHEENSERENGFKLGSIALTSLIGYTQLKDYKDTKPYFIRVYAKIKISHSKFVLEQIGQYLSNNILTSQQLELWVCDNLEFFGYFIIIDYPSGQLFIFDSEKDYYQATRFINNKYMKNYPDMEYDDFRVPSDSFLGTPKSIKFVGCDKCGSVVMNFVLEYPFAKNLSFAQCSQCKINFMNPQPLVSFWRKIYSDWYFKQGQQHTEVGYFDYEGERDSRLMKAEDQAILIDEFIANAFSTTDKTLLEIGFGYGYFLHAMQKRGWEVAGIDISAHAVAKAKEIFPDLSNLHEGVIEEISFGAKKFQVVALFDVMEHCTSPTNTLKKIYDLMNVGGVLIFRTPTIKHDDIPQTHLGEHIWHYSIEHLKELLDKTGFELVGIVKGSFFSARGKERARVRAVSNIYFIVMKKGYLSREVLRQGVNPQALIDKIVVNNQLRFSKSTTSDTELHELALAEQFERIFEDEKGALESKGVALNDHNTVVGLVSEAPVVVLSGPSGSGKGTLFRVLSDVYGEKIFKVV